MLRCSPMIEAFIVAVMGALAMCLQNIGESANENKEGIAWAAGTTAAYEGGRRAYNRYR